MHSAAAHRSGRSDPCRTTESPATAHALGARARPWPGSRPAARACALDPLPRRSRPLRPARAPRVAGRPASPGAPARRPQRRLARAAPPGRPDSEHSARHPLRPGPPALRSGSPPSAESPGRDRAATPAARVPPGRGRRSPERPAPRRSRRRRPIGSRRTNSRAHLHSCNDVVTPERRVRLPVTPGKNACGSRVRTHFPRPLSPAMSPPA